MVERYPERLGAPKAHALSPRSLELLRQFKLDSKRLRQLGTRRRDAFWVNFLTNMSGPQVGVLPYERMDTDVLNDTPEVCGGKSTDRDKLLTSKDDSQYTSARLRAIRHRCAVKRSERRPKERRIVCLIDTGTGVASRYGATH